MKLLQYTNDLATQWDDFISSCPMATFLHSRKFLSYHGNRFKDVSVIVSDDNDNWMGAFPAAVNPNDPLEVVSHPGSTYGGLLHQGKLNGSAMIEGLSLLATHYKESNYCKLIYKAIPSFYHTVPSQDDLYALFALKAKLYRRDLSCTIDLRSPPVLSNKAQSKMRNMIRKAEKNNVILDDSLVKLEELWALLTENLTSKYDKKPTHSLEEISSLVEMFPENIKIVTANLNNKVIAGTVLFKKNSTIHTQYLANSETGKELFALDYVIQTTLNKAKEDGYSFLDFGISTENDGLTINNGLHLSKAKHGGLGTVHDFYALQL